MTRDLVVFTEGKRDTQFLESLCRRCLDDPTIERLDMGDESGDTLVARETNKIDRFTDPWREWDLLLKSEGGKPKLRKAFPQLLFDIYDKDPAFCLFFDLDIGQTDSARDGLEEEIANINERLESRSTARRTVRVEPSSDLNQYRRLVTCRAEFRIGGDPRCEFALVAFKSTLETVAGIDKGADDAVVQERKARALAENGDVREPIVRTLFD